MATSETLRSVIDAGRSSKRLDELSSARVIGKVALLVHAAQQKAGAGKSIGPITPARIALAESGAATLQTGEAVALGYSSPEQVKGGSGDRRSDVFSLGTVLWEALTHQRLFDAMNDAAVKAAVKEREIKPPGEVNANVPAELSAICMRALSRNPADRYQSLKAMAVEIEEFLEQAGYTDDDLKIAQFLAGIPKPAATAADMAGEPRPRRSTGADLAAALAKAGSTSAASTAVGIPAAPTPEEWQDNPAPAPAPSPLAAAVPAEPAAAVTAAAPASTAPAPAPASPASPTPAPTAPATAAAPAPARPAPAPAPASPASAASAPATAAPARSAPATASPAPTAPATAAPATASPAPTAPATAAAPAPARPAPAPATASPASATASPASAASAPATAAAPAPATSVVATASAPASGPSGLLEPRPPVLPANATATRVDKSTIAVAIAPQVKVATAGASTTTADPSAAANHIEAKHVEAKPAAVIVEDKPAALIVDEPATETKDAADSKHTLLGTAALTDTRKTIVDATPLALAADDKRATIVDAKPPEVVLPPVLPSSTRAPSQSEGLPRAKSDSESGRVRAKSESGRVRARSESGGGRRARSKSEGGRAKSHSEGAPRARSQSEGSAPHPAAVVSLPGRDSKADLLAGWGWGTGKHDAIAPDGYSDDGDELYDQPNPRKPLMYAIGGGLAVALLITIVAFAFGGSKGKNKPAANQGAKPAAADTPRTGGSSESTPPAPPGSVETGVATGGQIAQPELTNAAADQEAATAAAADAETERAQAAKAEAEKAEAEKAEAEKAEAEKAEAEKAEAKKAELAKTEAAKAKAEAAKADAKKSKATAKADPKTAAKTTAKTDPKTVAKTSAKTDPKTTAKADPKNVAKAEPPKTDGKLDVETAYRIGLQQFARGDTTGALASLRTSLAGNPNYAPTWRGLGLVFEKMGEKDQARAAYKRYLQLAPSAGDAQIIKGKLERLGS